MALQGFTDKVVQIAVGGVENSLLFALTDKGKIYVCYYGGGDQDRHFFKEIKGVK